MMKPIGVRRAVFVLAFVVGFACQQAALAAPPQTINYQGTLSSAGTPVNGATSVTFRLYNVAMGGAALWSEAQSVSVVNGLFSVPLGNVSTFASAGLAFDVPYFLGITVGADAEMTPRPALTSAPYALRASVAEALPALRVKADVSYPGLIGGASVNTIPAALSSVIGGGGGNGGLAGAPSPDNNVPYGPNVISGIANAAVIAGGSNNRIIYNDNGPMLQSRPVFATIGGGEGNINYAYIGTVAGGRANTAGQIGFSAFGSTVGGGFGNQAYDSYGTISGGASNQAGFYAVVPGGANNLAVGQFTFAAGRGAFTATDGGAAAVRHFGTFLWADSNANGAAVQNFFSTANDQFAVRARGGVVFRVASTTDAGAGAGCALPAGGGAWSCTSDRNLKEGFVNISPLEILNKVAALPLSTWSFKGTDRRYLGPMAQDFRAAFGLGVDDKNITTSDIGGVALAAIQGLYQLLQERDREISRLQSTETELAKLKRELDEIKSALGIRSPIQ